MPSLVGGDDRAQLTTSYSWSEISDEVGADALWRRRGASEASEVVRVEAAGALGEFWQGGLSLPFVRRTRAAQSSTGWGDVTGTLGYEYLPDWDYHPWRPRGVGFIQLTMPTGRSLQEADGAFLLDARGRGFWAFGAGTLLTKVWGRWDLHASAEIHRSFAKKYSIGPMEGELRPGFGGTLGAGFGCSFGVWRWGGSLNWTGEEPVEATGFAPSQGSAQRFATANVSGSYLFKGEWAMTVGYTDQTLFGQPVSALLGRGVAVSLQKRWLR